MSPPPTRGARKGAGASRPRAKIEPDYRQLFDHNPQPMWVYDRETLRFLAVNDAAVRSYGYSRDRFLAMTLAEIRPEEDVPALRATIEEVGESVVRESIWRHRLSDGRIIDVEISSHPVEFEGHHARLVLASDVTRRLAIEEALRASEHEQRRLAWQLDLERQRLTAAQAVARIGSWETDLVSLEVVWSEETHRIFETDLATFRPSHERFLERVHPDDRDAVNGAFRHSFSTREVQTIEHRLLMPDGRVKHVEERWRTYVDDEDRPLRALGTCQDVTERRVAERELKASEERFRLLARATNDAIWDWNLVTGALWWNEGFEALFGYRRDEVESTIESWTSRVHPDDFPRIVPDVERAIADGDEFWSGEYRYRRKDGSWAYVLDRGHVLRDDNGKAVRMIGGMTDLTERRRVEERLAEQAALLEATHEAILVKTLEDRIVYWNKGAERTYGWTAEEAVGRTSEELLYDDPSQIAPAVAAVLATGRWQGQLRHRTKGGGLRDIEASCTLLRDEHGAPKAVLSFNVDITERRSLEAQLLRAQRLESIGTMAGGIAHDLNNVLAPILMAIELLRSDQGEPQRSELIDTIEASAKRGADMVRQVLSFARGVEGRKVVLDVATVVSDVGKILRDALPKNIEFEAELPKDLWRVAADRTQLHQVLMNLCVNARDAMPAGGRLTVAADNVVLDERQVTQNAAAVAGAYVQLEVADSGTGIDPEHHDRLFEPFFTTKEVGSGTGLGLATARTIVHAHGGFITVESEPGQGASFRVYLPAAAAAAGDDLEARGPGELPRGDREWILVVDDEASVRNVTRQTLESFGYRVLLAANGAEAAAIFGLRRREIALVLTDMSMPVMDGAATIAALQSIDPGVRVVAASGLAAQPQLARAMEAGARRFVPKPYSAETLLRVVREVLTEPG